MVWLVCELHAWGVPLQFVVAQLQPYCELHVVEVLNEAHGVSVPTQAAVLDQLQYRFALHVVDDVNEEHCVAVPVQVEPFHTQPAAVQYVA